MVKIEWDIVNGVKAVKEFSDNIEIIEGFELSDLREDFQGIRGAEIGDDEFAEVYDSYGVDMKELDPEYIWNNFKSYERGVEHCGQSGEWYHDIIKADSCYKEYGKLHDVEIAVIYEVEKEDFDLVDWPSKVKAIEIQDDGKHIWF